METTPPAGDSCLADMPQRPVILLSGGVSLTPIVSAALESGSFYISVLRALSGRQTDLLFSGRTASRYANAISVPATTPDLLAKNPSLVAKRTRRRRAMQQLRLPAAPPAPATARKRNSRPAGTQPALVARQRTRTRWPAIDDSICVRGIDDDSRECLGCIVDIAVDYRGRSRVERYSRTA